MSLKLGLVEPGCTADKDGLVFRPSIVLKIDKLEAKRMRNSKILMNIHNI